MRIKSTGVRKDRQAAPPGRPSGGIDLLWSIFSQSPIPTLIRSIKEGQNIKYNHAMYQLTGYSLAEVPDVRTWLSKLYPDKTVRKEVNRRINMTFLQELDLKGYEAVIRRRDGQTRSVEFSLYNVSIQDDPPEFQVVEALDITERKRAVEELKLVNEKLRQWNQELDLSIQERAQELHESESRLKMALEGANEGLWVIDFQENKMLFSAKSAEMLGYQLEDLGSTSEKWDQITHPEDWPLVQQRLIDHFEGRTPYYEAEYRAQTKSGAWKWILGHGRVVKWNEDRKPIQAIGTHVDITKLKETEIELRLSEEKFRNLVENAPFGIIIVNSDRRIEYINPQFQSIFGYSERELLHLDDWLKRSYPEIEQRRTALDICNQMLAGTERESSEAFQFKVRSKGGDLKVVLVKFVSFSQSCMATCEDITKIAEAHDALQNREKELAIKSSSLEEMNTALRVLLKRREEDEKELEEKVLYNVKDLVLPYIAKLEQTRLSSGQKAYLGILKSNLKDIVSPFARRLAASHLYLTPKEIQVANLLKEDLITKEIAEALHISESSVEFHRHNIRRKLGLVNQRINLKTFLQSLRE